MRQDLAAMKICTDACLFGAWTAKRLGDALHILDIGTGTGLLTLMLAQKKFAETGASLEAIEIDEPAYRQASDNFAGSSWSGKITLHHGDVTGFSFAERFDFIIVNPPFFEGQLRSPDASVNTARHEDSLTLETLLVVLKRLLEPAGRFSILLPASREEFFYALAAGTGFTIEQCCRLKQTPDHAAFRSMMLFSFAPDTNEHGGGDYRLNATEITLRDRAGMETSELLAEMTEYYIR